MGTRRHTKPNLLFFNACFSLCQKEFLTYLKPYSYQLHEMFFWNLYKRYDKLIFLYLHKLFTSSDARVRMFSISIYDACVNALLDRRKSLSKTPWLFLFEEIYLQFELQRFLLHHVCYVIKFICTSSFFKENVTLSYLMNYRTCIFLKLTMGI
jgi:hypothetical protein